LARTNIPESTMHVRTTLALATLALLQPAAVAHAQAPKLTLPLVSLQTGAALTAAQAALARCQKDGFTVAVAVVDRAGNALALLRDPLAGAHTVPTAMGKAWTAVSFRTDTTELAAATQAGRVASGIRELPQVIAVGGGLMIRARGVLMGGIGVSGAPGGLEDDVCAKAGIDAIVDAIELE